jgi:DNA recombination protein RmuC
MEILIFLLGLAVGVGVGFGVAWRLKQRSSEDIRQAQEGIQQTFDVLAQKALRENNAQFLELAQTKFEVQEKVASKELLMREEAIKAVVEPLKESLASLDKSQQALEGKREKSYGELKAHLDNLGQATNDLLMSSSSLNSVLKGSSQARGRWGEMALKNIVEAAGMTEHCDFTEQTQDAGGNRPDLIVKLPGEGLIPVDAKTPFVDYERYMNETDPARRKEHLKNHEAALRKQVKDLVTKDYAKNLGGEIDFTVMFVPLEPMLAAAFEVNPELHQDALTNRVLLATPVTLIALLRTVGIYWRQLTVAKSAQEVWAAASQLYERVATFQANFEKVGKGLEGALEAYNKAVGTFTGRVLPAGRKLAGLGVAKTAKKTLEDMEAIEGAVREMPGVDK